MVAVALAEPVVFPLCGQMPRPLMNCFVAFKASGICYLRKISALNDGLLQEKRIGGIKLI